MSIIRICESDNFNVDYDRDRGMYRVSVFKDGGYEDVYWFDAYEEKEVNPEMGLYLYSKGFIRGAAELIEYMRKNHRNGIYPYDMTDILKEFCSQYGELKELNI